MPLAGGDIQFTAVYIDEFPEIVHFPGKDMSCGKAEVIKAVQLLDPHGIFQLKRKKTGRIYMGHLPPLCTGSIKG